MARFKGTFNFAANFEPLVKAPLDGRQVVGLKADLIDPSIWADDNGQIWLYDGALVIVANDTSTNSGVYWLSDEDNYTLYSSWIKIGSSNDVEFNIVNVGDASGIDIYAGQDASDNFQLRKLNNGEGIALDVSNNTINISAIGDATGQVFITDVTATSSGTVGFKQYEPNTTPSNIDITQCTTDTDDVTLHFIAEGGTYYSPEITLDSSSPDTFSQFADDRRLFYGTFAIDVNLAADASVVKTIISDAGTQDTVKIIKSGSGPTITDVSFGPYPGSQTSLKEDDNINVYVTVENDATNCWVESDKASKNLVNLSLGSSDSGGAGYKLASGTITISSVTSNSPIDTQASNALGTNGAVYTSGNLTIDQDSPAITFNSITYPGSQEALKDSEQADVDITITDYTSVQYYDLLSQINIPNQSTYSQVKSVTRYAGGYNISTDNYEVVAWKSSNDTSSNYSTVVYIADTAATIDISSPARLRSGGNQGTSAQDHTITINGNQQLLSAPSVDNDIGTWQGAGFAGGPSSWTRALQIHDDDSKGTGTFSNLAATNLAGIVTTSINSGSNYTVGGFVFRTFYVPAFPNRDSSIGTNVTNTSKLRCTNLSTGDSGSLNWSYVGTKSSTDDSYTIIDGDGGIQDPGGNYWYNCDDANASSNTSGLLQIELEEIV